MQNLYNFIAILFWHIRVHIIGLVLDSGNFIANALKSLQSCPKPLMLWSAAMKWWKKVTF